MQTRSLLFAVAALALALAGCDQSDFAKELLEKDGYTDIAVKKDGDHHYAFTAKKAGQSCTGSMNIKGNRQNYESSTNVSCGP